LRDFETFPEGATSICLAALTIAAEGGKADIVKPMRGMGPGVFETALPFRGVRSASSTRCNSPMTSGWSMRSRRSRRRASRRPRARLIKDRLKRLKEMLR